MKRLLSLLISLTLLGFMYWKIGPENRSRLAEIFRNCDPLWMGASLGMVIPLTLFTSLRLQHLMPKAGQLPFAEANRLILTASVLNLVLPSKMGDIAKAWFMRDRSGLNGSLALSLVVFEKSCDMLSLLLWCVFGLALYPQKEGLFWILTLAVTSLFVGGTLLIGSKRFAHFFFTILTRYTPDKLSEKIAQLSVSWAEMHDYFWASKPRLARVLFNSFFIWFLHLLQIWMFIVALRLSVPFLRNLALSPLAILAGLLPVPTFGGAGTRDGALVALYAPYFASPEALALGLLCTARYLLPALGGLPFAGHYLAALKTLRAGQTTSSPSVHSI
jgi:uncharacterized protein (TIRG00374 family)